MDDYKGIFMNGVYGGDFVNSCQKILIRQKESMIVLGSIVDRGSKHIGDSIV